MLERFDIHLEVPRVNLSDFDDAALVSESSASVAARVRRAREIQIARQGKCNARLSDGQITRLCAPDKEAQDDNQHGHGAARILGADAPEDPEARPDDRGSEW